MAPRHSAPRPVGASKAGRNPERIGRHAAMLVATEQSKLGGVRLKAVHQLARAGSARYARPDLIRGDA